MNGSGSDGPALVIFDCDGVLVDSEALSFRTLAASLAEIGVRLDPATAWRRFLGRSDADTYAQIAAETGRALPPDFAARRQARLLAAIDRGLEPVPGVREVLAASGLPRCVASSGEPERIRRSLAAAGVARFFATRSLFSAQQVPRGKPAPDLFLFAARTMGFPPGRCTVVEDSPAGVRAAVAAGMRVLGFADARGGRAAVQRTELRAAGARVVFGRMHELPGLLARPRAGDGQRPPKR